MKLIDKELKKFALASAFMVGGLTMSAQAQVMDRTQTQNQTQTELQDQEEIDYEDMFNGTDNTEEHNVMALLKMDDNFSIFVELIEESGLEASFDFSEPVTILAPTNEAFKQLTKEEYSELRDGENRAKLNTIIQAHVMPRKVYIREFENNQVISNADGDIPVERAGNFAGGGPARANDIIIGGATIVKADVEASNGLIHVLDGVIIPGQTTVTTGPY